MDEQRNLILAVVVAVGLVFAWHYIYVKPRLEQEMARQAEQEAVLEAPAPIGAPPAVETGVGPPPPPEGVAAPAVVAPTDTRSEALARSGRITIDAPRLHGSIALQGGRIDDVSLANYRETLEPDSPEIVLLNPPGLPNSYFAEFGWVSGGDAMPLPDAATLWRADGETLAPGRPVTVTWDNGQGLVFQRTYAVDENYMFTVTQRVENTGESPVTLFPYGLVSRSGTPPTLGFFILHEGPLGVFDGTLKEVDYDDLRDDRLIEQPTTGGWIGITDKYWLAALIPDQDTSAKTRFSYASPQGVDKYQVDFLGAEQTVPGDGSVEVQTRFFAGAKRARLLDRYMDEGGVTRFDLAIDWGWFAFLTKPIFYGLDYFHRLLGNFGLGILLLTVLIKLVFFPLANKSYRAMSRMKRLQPEMLDLRERFKEDRARLNQETMALYKREKVNPAAGCLPILVQIPVFFALYKVLFVSIEMRHAPFYGWIQDLSAPDPTSVFTLFGLVPLDLPLYLNVGAWPLIMGLSMYLQQKLNPQPPDPVQAKMFLALPVVFTFLLARFPAGLVIYWAWNNLLSIAQQWVIMRRAGAT
jgi:YidC/Oxa1 family membrane protein insertase